jgi:predicted Fe-Mo cluster-binding NifX family protein
MKIAVTSQNRKSITEHAGRCRKFRLFEIEDGRIAGTELLEFAKEQSFHESSPHEAHPLDVVDVLISGGMGNGMIQRLRNKGVTGIITSQSDPETAVVLYLKGKLQSEEPHEHSHHEHQQVKLEL